MFVISIIQVVEVSRLSRSSPVWRILSKFLFSFAGHVSLLLGTIVNSLDQTLNFGFEHYSWFLIIVLMCLVSTWM